MSYYLWKSKRELPPITTSKPSYPLMIIISKYTYSSHQSYVLRCNNSYCLRSLPHIPKYSPIMLGDSFNPLANAFAPSTPILQNPTLPQTLPSLRNWSLPECGSTSERIFAPVFPMHSWYRLATASGGHGITFAFLDVGVLLLHLLVHLLRFALQSKKQCIELCLYLGLLLWG